MAFLPLILWYMVSMAVFWIVKVPFLWTLKGWNVPMIAVR